jgi:acetyl esterase/lipase
LALRRADDGLLAIEDHTIPGPAGPLPVRVYRPRGPTPPPVVVYCHGGGWVVGGIDTHDATTSALAARSGCAVVSVEYRLAPEHPFPAGLEDCYGATDWLAREGDRLDVDGARLAVAGDSSGGNTAAAVCLLARERGGPAISLQLLVYPATDHFGDWPTYHTYGDGSHGLSLSLLMWFSRQYLPDPGQAEDWRASPIRAPDLSRLPPALVITAEHDLLRDEGEAYGRRLAESGVSSVVRRFPGVPHGFFAIRESAERDTALDEAAHALRDALLPPVGPLPRGPQRAGRSARPIR